MRDIKYKTFRGRGPFPLDMLRFDHCWPKSQVDVNTIYESLVYQDDEVTYRQVSVGSNSMYYSIRQWAIFNWYPWDAAMENDTRIE